MIKSNDEPDVYVDDNDWLVINAKNDKLRIKSSDIVGIRQERHIKSTHVGPLVGFYLTLCVTHGFEHKLSFDDEEEWQNYYNLILKHIKNYEEQLCTIQTEVVSDSIRQDPRRNKIIYTSYLDKVNRLDKNLYEPIFIASKWPKDIESMFIWYKPLAPDLKLIGSYTRKEITTEEYIEQYNQMLETLNPMEVYAQISSMCSLNKCPVLICYEAPPEFCHRHLVAKWLNEHAFPCQELYV